MSISVPKGLEAKARAGDVPGARLPGVLGDLLGVPGVCGVCRGVPGVPLEGVPEERCGVSGTTSCCEDLVVLDGVGASDDARESGRFDGVDIFNFSTSNYKTDQQSRKCV